MNIETLRNRKGEVWLNIASSFDVLEDFTNLDHHVLMFALEYPFLRHLIPKRNREVFERYKRAQGRAQLIRHDCRNRLPLPANSVDHILCSHFLEHVFEEEAHSIVSDFHRVLKHAGTAHVIVPDLSMLVDQYIRTRQLDPGSAASEFMEQTLLTRKQRPSLKFRLLEALGGFGLQHRWMYDRPALEKMMRQAGFNVIQANETPSRLFRKNDDSVHIIGQKMKSQKSGS